MDWVGAAWLLSAVAGAGIGLYALREGVADLRALGNRRNGRRIIARGYVRTQLFRLAIFSAWTIIGIPVLADGRTTPLNPVTAILVASNLALAAASLFDIRDRRRLQRGA